MFCNVKPLNTWFNIVEHCITWGMIAMERQNDNTINGLAILLLLFLAARLVFIASHEAGHAIAEIITGGSVTGITMNPFTPSGYVYTLGGNEPFMLACGQLGTLVIIFLILAVAFTLTPGRGRWLGYLAAFVSGYDILEAFTFLDWADTPYLIAASMWWLVAGYVLIAILLCLLGLKLGRSTVKQDTPLYRAPMP